MINLRK